MMQINPTAIGYSISARLTPVVTWLGFSEESVHYIAMPLAFVVITFLHITLGEQAPKIVAIHAARSTALVISPPLAIFASGRGGSPALAEK